MRKKDNAQQVTENRLELYISFDVIISLFVN